ncbi:MAG: hypothetical protein ACEPOV_10160 [Hyphomicrobiales bacterium]
MKKFLQIFFLILTVSVVSCSKSSDSNNPPSPPTPTPDEPLQKIDEATTNDGNFVVDVYGYMNYFQGYNLLFFAIKDKDDKIVKSAEINLSLIITDVEGTHNLPVDDPAQAADENDHFGGGVVFLYPNGNDVSYSMTVEVKANGIDDIATFTPKPVSTFYNRADKFASKIDGKNIITSIVAPITVGKGEAHHLKFYVAREISDNVWEPYSGLIAYALIDKNESSKFDLSFVKDKFYSYSQAITYPTAGKVNYYLYLQSDDKDVNDPTEYTVDVLE